MAKLRAGILGQVTGKVSGVVGGTWKEVNYIREYIIPANPNSAAQQVQRGLFAGAVEFCQPLVGPVFNVYSDQFQSRMSGFNFFIKDNITYFTSPPAYSSVFVTRGKLFYPRVVSIAPASGTNSVDFTTSVSLGSNGKDDDGCYAVALNVDSGRWGFAAAEYDRSAGSSTQSVPLTMASGDKIELYVFAAQRVGTKIAMISESDHMEGFAT